MDVDQSCQEFPEHSPEVFDFLSEYFEDVESGESHGLEHYLRRFPACESAIRKEFEALTTGQAGAPAQDGRLGSQVGPYELLSEIGRGGQGVVYLAEDSRIARRVALKVLPPAALLFSDSRRKRLQREAEVISRLAHPGICGIFDADMDGEFAYIAMPLIEGRTLASLIPTPGTAPEPAASGPGHLRAMPTTAQEFQVLLSFFERAARALHSAHEAGVVHRDVKPGNLMVTPTGAPVWLDFGQARDDQTGGVDLTLSGEIFGTPAYMSPEQVSGGTVDVRTDVWALTVSLFEALTRRRPFEGATAHVLMLSIKNDEPLDAREINPRISKELAVLLATGLERDAARRYSSAQALADDLARLQRQEPIHARAAGKLLRLRRWGERHPALAVLAMAMVVALAVSSRLVLLKNAALDVALGRLLAGRSEALLVDSPASALLLAIQAVEEAPDAGTRARLFGALQACYLRAEYEAGHERVFLDVVLVPGDEYVACVWFDGEVGLFDLLSGKRLRGWKAHAACESRQGAAADLAVSADGERLASGAMDGRIVVARVDGVGAPLTFDGPGGGIVELLFGRDGQTLLARGKEGGLALYDAQAGKLLQVLEQGAPGSGSLALDSRNGFFYERHSKVGSVPTLKLWNDRNAAVIDGLAGPPPSVDWAQWSSRGWSWLSGGILGWRKLGQEEPLQFALGTLGDLTTDSEQSVHSLSLSGSGEHCLAALNTANGMHCYVLDLEAASSVRLALDFASAPRAVVFSGNGKRVALIAPNSRPMIFDCKTGEQVAEGVDYMGQDYLQWSADDQFLLSRQHVGPQAQLWYGTERPDLYRMDCGRGPVLQTGFVAGGERAFTLTEGGDLRLWETPLVPKSGHHSGALFVDVTTPGFPLKGAKLNVERTRLLAWGSQGARSWDPASGAEVRRSALRADVLTVDESGPSKAWLLLDAQGQVWIEGLADGSLRALAEESSAVQLARFAPGGHVFLTAHASGQLCCWDSQSLALRWSMPFRKPDETAGAFEDLAFSPGAETVAVAWSQREIHFLRVADGQPARKLLNVFPPKSLDWSGDGRRLVITGQKGRGAFRVEDLQPATPELSWMRAEEFHRDNLTGARFHPDGSLVLSTSADGTVMVRDVGGSADPRATLLLAHLQGDGGAVRCADFSPSSKAPRVIAGMADGSARVWPVDPLPAALARRPREQLREWEFAREQRIAAPLQYR